MDNAQFKMRSAFTLVELLVVISILCILFALLFPIIINIRAKAKQFACVSNMNQLYLGIIVYADDFSNRLVPTGVSHRPDWVGYMINKFQVPRSGLIWPYVNEEKVYLCPADSKWRNPANPCWVPKVGTHSYSIPYKRDGDLMQALDQTKALLVDESETTINDGLFINAFDTFASRHRLSGSNKQTTSNAGGNILFADGHVEFFSAEFIANSQHEMFK
jgi:prepilin-type N-terminal cleavage/methylation domain-containing protein/prepilin-type processing-associated H-X9-DG protein